MSLSIVVPVLPDLETEAEVLAKVPVSFAITDSTSFELAGYEFRRASAYLKAVDAEFKTIDRHQIDARNATIALRKRLEAPAVAVRDAASRAMGAWEAEQKRLADEAARGAREAMEAAQAEAIAEAKREGLRLRKLAEDAAIESAQAAQERGDVALADKIISAPVTAPTVAPRVVFAPPPVVQAAPRLDGVGFRTYYRAEVTDLTELVAAVAAGKVALNAIQANQPALNSLAEGMMEHFNVPGCRLVTDRRSVNRPERGRA